MTRSGAGGGVRRGQGDGEGGGSEMSGMGAVSHGRVSGVKG